MIQNYIIQNEFTSSTHCNITLLLLHQLGTMLQCYNALAMADTAELFLLLMACHTATAADFSIAAEFSNIAMYIIIAHCIPQVLLFH